jgi:hypothetical protein
MRRATCSSLAAALIALGAANPEAQPAAPRWSTRATEHFDLYFQPAQGTRVDAVAREAERAYARVSNLLRYDLAARMDILLLASDRDQPLDPAGAYQLVRVSGASFRDHLLLSVESFDRQGPALLVHELTHQFMFELVPDVGGGAAWIAEALPDHHAGAWDPAELTRLRDAVANGRIPDVSRLTAADRHWGRAVFDFVAAEYGARGIRAYLEALRESPISMRDPIRVAFDTTPAEFNAAFRGFARARFGR